MESNLEQLLEGQQLLKDKINAALIESAKLNLDILKLANQKQELEQEEKQKREQWEEQKEVKNTFVPVDRIETNISRIYHLLNDDSKSLSGEQRKNLFRCRADLISLRTQRNLLLQKSEEFVNKVEQSTSRITKIERSEVLKVSKTLETTDVINSPQVSRHEDKSKIKNNESFIETLKNEIKPQIVNNEKITSNEENSKNTNENKILESVIADNIKKMNRVDTTKKIEPVKKKGVKKREKSAVVKKIEANLGLYFMIAIGTLLCLFGVSVFGKYVYLNMLGNVEKGMIMYVVSVLVLLTGQLFLKKVKDIVIVKESIVGLGLGLLYLTTLVNFLVLDNISYIVTHCLLILISLYALYLSRNSTFDVIRIVGMIGIYIALIPISEPTIGSSLYILLLGYFFTVLNILVPLKNTKYFELLNIIAIIAFSILVNIYTSILVVNILNSVIAIGLTLYIYYKSEVKSPELYLFSFAANIIVLSDIVNHSEVLSILITVVVLCYLPLLNDIADEKKQITYKTIALVISTILLCTCVKNSSLFIILLNVVYFANIYYSSLVKNVYEHKFEFILLISFNTILLVSNSLSIIYLISGLIPTLYTLSRCNYKKEINYIVAIILEILSFRIYFDAFDVSNEFTVDMIIIVYSIAAMLYNFVLFKEQKVRKINMLVFFLFSMILFRSIIFVSIVLMIFVALLFKRKIQNNMSLYITMISIIKLSYVSYYSIESNYILILFMITVFLAVIYMYKFYSDFPRQNVFIVSLITFGVVSFVIKSPILIVILILAILGVFYKREKSLLDVLNLGVVAFFVMTASYENSYMIYILLFALYITISLLKWSKIEFFNISYYVFFTLIIQMVLRTSDKWFILIVIAINILVAQPVLKNIRKHFKTGSYAYSVFSLIGLIIFGFIFKDTIILCGLTLYYLGCLIVCSEEDSESISIILLVASCVLAFNASGYIIPIILICILNYKKIIIQKNIDPFIIILLIISMLKCIGYKNPIIFVLATVIICISRYISSIKDLNVYKEYKQIKFTIYTLIGILAIIIRVFVYVYLLNNVIGTFIYAIVSGFVIILIGFYVDVAWFRKLGLGSAMATCGSILIFINGMDTIQKTFVCCGVGVTCIIIAIVYSKLEKKYIKQI